MSARDAGLLDVAALSASKAADLIGKSRQAVSRGLHLEEDYFNLGDVQRLHSAVVAKRPELKERIADYIRENYKALEKYVGGTPVDIDLQTAIATASSAWLFTADYMNLSVREPHLHQAIVDIIKNRNIEFTAFVNGEVDKERFRRAAAENAPTPKKNDRIFVYDKCNFINAMPTMLLFNPRTPTAFMMGVNDWYKMNQIEIRRILDGLYDELQNTHANKPTAVA